MLSGLIHKWCHWSRSARNIFKVVIQSGSSSLKLSGWPSYGWFCKVFLRGLSPCNLCLESVSPSLQASSFTCSALHTEVKEYKITTPTKRCTLVLCLFGCILQFVLKMVAVDFCQCLHGKVCHRIGSMYTHPPKKSYIWDRIDFWRVTSVSVVETVFVLIWDEFKMESTI